MSLEDDEYLTTPIVMLRDEGVMGVLVEEGAHVSTVKYFMGGIEYVEIIENDEFVVIDNILFEYIDEDEQD